MKNSFASALLVTLAFVSPLHAEDKTDAKDYVMLKVNGDPIKHSEVEDAWKAVFAGRQTPPMDAFGDKMKEKFLREFASEHVLYEVAKKQGLEDSAEVKATMEKIKHQIMIQQLLKDKTKDAVTDDKLKALYDAQLSDAAAQGPDHDELHARHILVATKDEADDIEKKLKKGVSFEKLAKEKSLDKSSGATGGDLGWFTGDKMLPDFTKAVLKLKKGEVSAPVKTDFGWHVIQLEDRRKPTPPKFEQVKDTLRQEAGNKAVGDYVKTIMVNAKITEIDAQEHEKTIAPVADDAADKEPAAGKNDAGKDNPGAE